MSMRSSGSPGKLAAVCGLRPVPPSGYTRIKKLANTFQKLITFLGGELDVPH